MPVERRKQIARLATAIPFMLALVVACNGRSPAPTRTPRSTVPPVITKIVPPPPTNTPLPTPTLPYDLFPVEGRWFIRVDLHINDSSLAEELRYSGSASFAVTLDGIVSGNGTFSPSISHPPCNADVEDALPLTFMVEGTTFVQGEQIGVNLTFLPDNPVQTEHFSIVCPEPGNDRTINQAILWPLLTSLRPRTLDTLTINALNWQIALVANQRHQFEADLSTETGGIIDGNLQAEIWLGRG